MKNVINRAFMAKKRILFVLAAVGLFAASSWAQVDPCAPVTDTVTVTFKLDDGSLTGNFSVAYEGGKYKKVAFSKGNLQYRATADGTGTDLTHAVAGGGTAQGIWRFAEHQWDFVGNDTEGNVYEIINEVSTKCNNKLLASNYKGWIDLFGWATSGWNNTAVDANAVNYQPYAANKNYQYGPSITNMANGHSWSESDATKNYDWGVYNAISNGGNTPGKWRTLTQTEWYYLLNSRNSSHGMPTIKGQSNARCAKANITTGGGTVNGLIVFPDNYDGPTTDTDDITWGTMNISTNHTDITLTTCTEAGWTVLEQAGCIFLPQTCYNENNNRTDIRTGFSYSSSTVYSEKSRAGLSYYSYNFSQSYLLYNAAHYRWHGSAVRLVKDVTE